MHVDVDGSDRERRVAGDVLQRRFDALQDEGVLGVGGSVGVVGAFCQECVTHIGLHRAVLRSCAGPEEGGQGDRDQQADDQHHDHHLDQREAVLGPESPSHIPGIGSGEVMLVTRKPVTLPA